MAGESLGLGGAASFIGNSIGEAAAFAAGLAIGPVLRPILQALENETWAQYPDKPLDPQTMAIAVAQGRIGADIGTNEAKQSGISPTSFANLVNFAQTYPDAAMLLDLSRRQILPSGDLIPALQRHGLTAEYAGFVAQLVDARLNPAQIALGIVRSLIADPGLMPVNLDTSGGVVPAYPQSNIDALTEAADFGIDKERLRVLVGEIGLPISTQQAASAYFRGIIKLADYNRSILEGDVRPEWAAAILEQARQILTPHDYVELHLRGWIDVPAMYAGTALHGMSQADTDLLFEVLGRPIPVHQILTGEARGGVYDGPTDGIPAPYLKSLQESNQRPEWYNLSYANRYTLPGYFVIKALLSAGTLNEAEGKLLYTQIGWPPDLAAKAAHAEATSGTTVKQKNETLASLSAEYESGSLSLADFTTALQGLGYTAEQASTEAELADYKSAKKYVTKAIDLVAKQYIGSGITQAQAEAKLAALNIPATAQARYLAAWELERELNLTTLTKAQIVKAHKLGTIDPSTALELLEDSGIAPADAQTLLTDA